MKILLFGKNGQVGFELNRSLQPLGEITALTRSEADFSNPESLRKIISELKPDVIVNAVAYTAVDKAEEQEGLAEKINAITPGVIAEEAAKIGALLVHYSTDYVFDGTKDSSYTESDAPNPINAYGRTKLAGEHVIQQSGCDYLIFRTSWVYTSRGHNFLLTMLKLAKEREQLSVVSDQLGSPTTARLIAETTLICIHQALKERLVGIFESGLYHLTASGKTSWFGFAEEIMRLAREQGLPVSVKQVNPVPTTSYPTPAKRPMNSQLSLNKLEYVSTITTPDWKTTLKTTIQERSPPL